MSVSSVALSSLATSLPAPTPVVAEGSRADRSANDGPVRPAPTTAPSQDNGQPVKAAVPLQVGKTIDISA